MADIDLPNNFLSLVRNSSFGLESNTQVFTSQLSKYVERSELDGARWRARYELVPMRRETFAELQSILIRLKGRVNRLNAYDPDATSPRGTVAGTILVNGASQTGTSLDCDGFANNATGLFLPGDYFEVGGELKMVTASVDSNGSGEATIEFEPPLRASPSDNASITYSTPKCKMILDNDSFQWDSNENKVYESVSFSLTEAFE